MDLAAKISSLKKIFLRPMITAASLIILCAIGVGALFLVSLINRQQAKIKQARQRIKMLKFRFDSLDELTVTLDHLVDTRAIARRVYDEALRTLNQMQQLDPMSAPVQASMSYAQHRTAELSDDYAPRELNRLKESDAQIARAQHALHEAGRILKQQCTRGEIAVSELDAYQTEIAWLILYIETISLVGRGMVCMQRGDIMGAFAFYKRAQHGLLQSEQVDMRRTRIIKELNEMIGKKRQTLSTDLMPEGTKLLREASHEHSFVTDDQMTSEVSNNFENISVFNEQNP